MAQEAAIGEARRLLRSARVGTLATTVAGQPFASLVTPATAPDLAILLFLSALSEHTRHLREDGRCSLLVAGDAVEANPQTAPRVSVTGLAERVDDPALQARWLALHPYAALYAGFTDFALWRIRPMAALLVAGFGRAARLTGAALAPDPASVAAVQAHAAGIIGHCNADHASALARLAGEPDAEWRMVAVDVDGCDLASGERVRRVAWRGPVRDAGEVRAELVWLVGGRK